MLAILEQIHLRVKAPALFKGGRGGPREWSLIPTERRVGILHCFILLRPILKRAFLTQQALQTLHQQQD
jgi:hypothetical protein